MDIVDVPIFERKFTWYKLDGSAMSRIDRFLLSEGFLSVWKVESQCVGSMDLSDHYPIWIRGNESN